MGGIFTVSLIPLKGDTWALNPQLHAGVANPLEKVRIRKISRHNFNPLFVYEEVYL